MSHAQNVSLSSFEDEVVTVLESSVPVIVDFYADRCGPCSSRVSSLQRHIHSIPQKVLVTK